jgi:hypothetical protein
MEGKEAAILAQKLLGQIPGTEVVEPDYVSRSHRMRDRILSVLDTSELFELAGTESLGDLLKTCQDLHVQSTLVHSNKSTQYFLIRQVPGHVHEIHELRICVVGNVDAGKSTLLGCLTHDCLDDGRGKARMHLFRHKHEVESGRTSSVGTEIMGLDSTGYTIN